MATKKAVKKGEEAIEKNEPFAALSKPAQRALANAHITTLEALAKLTEKEFMALHGIGKTALPVVKKAMEERGLGFKREKN